MQSLLKFITCGSVDDGKSTLIGHMLYDAKLLFADQKRALELDSRVGSTEGQIYEKYGGWGIFCRSGSHLDRRNKRCVISDETAYTYLCNDGNTIRCVCDQ